MTHFSADPQWRSIEHRFAENHPTVAGHFPGNPIIPGALVLDHVLRAISVRTGSKTPWDIRVVKFLRPVRPGDAVTIRSRNAPNGEIVFECHLIGSQEPAVAGSLMPRAR